MLSNTIKRACSTYAKPAEMVMKYAVKNIKQTSASGILGAKTIISALDDAAKKLIYFNPTPSEFSDFSSQLIDFQTKYPEHSVQGIFYDEELTLHVEVVGELVPN